MYAKDFVGYCEKLGSKIPVCTHYTDDGLVLQVDCPHASCRHESLCPLYREASAPDIRDT